MRYRLALLAVLVTVAACKQGSSDPGNPNGPSGNTQNTISIIPGAYQGSGGFSPSEITIALGTTITFKNNDSVQHDPVSDTGGFGGFLDPGQSFPATPATKGTFAYHCTIHPAMSGSVIVQ